MRKIKPRPLKNLPPTRGALSAQPTDSQNSLPPVAPPVNLAFSMDSTKRRNILKPYFPSQDRETEEETPSGSSPSTPVKKDRTPVKGVDLETLASNGVDNNGYNAEAIWELAKALEELDTPNPSNVM